MKGPSQVVDVVSSSQQADLRHINKPLLSRVPDYLPAQFPVDVDVFPYTEDEVDGLPFPQEALRGARVL